VDAVPLGNDGRAWLQRLLGATQLDVFFEHYWERQHLFVPASRPTAYDDILSLGEFDRFFSRNDVRYPALQMVKAGRNLPLGDYTRPLKIGTYSSDGLIDMDRVAQAYRNGGTVIVQLMQNSFASLAEFAKSLGVFLRGRVDVHAFMTPSAAQGLGAHYDAASAFLIQLRGEKRWRLYQLEMEAPAPDQTFNARDPIKGNPIDEITLHAGDVIYLPRGLPHEGLTFDSDSLHLTVVLFPKSWIDIFSSVLRECEKDEDFRKAPTGYFVDDGSAADLSEAWFALGKRFAAQASQVNRIATGDIFNVVSPRSRRGRWV